MRKWDFISQPNKCDGWPVEKMTPLGAKVRNICHLVQTRYDIFYGLDDQGHQVCYLRERERKTSDARPQTSDQSLETKV